MGCSADAAPPRMRQAAQPARAAAVLAAVANRLPARIYMFYFATDGRTHGPRTLPTLYRGVSRASASSGKTGPADPLAALAGDGGATMEEVCGYN